MTRAWIIDGRSIAKKVSGVSRSCAHQIEDCGATRECPNCNHLIDNSDVAQEWPGLPAGVKFDPSDLQLVEHLAAKCGVGNSKPHLFIDEFIPTLSDDKGICYTHPGKLPGSKKDGDSVHFFHRTINAYATGQRKRRRVHSDLSSNEESVRWHKTGKTKYVMDKGVQKGCKKIMVLYKRSKKGTKPVKSNWVMHQYHLGTEEDEKEGEYVVSKIFYQQKQNVKNDNDPIIKDEEITANAFNNPIIEDKEIMAFETTPRTPNPNPPNPPRAGKSVMYDDFADDIIMQWHLEGKKINNEACYVSSPAVRLDDDAGYPEWLAGESQAVDDIDFSGIDETLLSKEIVGNNSPFLYNYSGLNHVSYTGVATNTNEVTGNNNNVPCGITNELTVNNTNVPCGIADLENLELDTPPDFQLTTLTRDLALPALQDVPVLTRTNTALGSTILFSGQHLNLYYTWE